MRVISRRRRGLRHRVTVGRIPRPLQELSRRGSQAVPGLGYSRTECFNHHQWNSISRQIRGANLGYKLTCRLYYMRYYKSDNTAKLTTFERACAAHLLRGSECLLTSSYSKFWFVRRVMRRLS